MESGFNGNDIVASVAMTLDGYIARLDGAVDYLEKYPLTDFNFEAWVERVGALVMGRTTYEQSLEWGWIWEDRPTMVLTGKNNLPVPDDANITFRAAPTADAVREFSLVTPKRLWVFGGGNVITAALLGGAVDVLDITVVPEALGAGIPLFTNAFMGPMQLVESVPSPNGAIRLVYKIGKNTALL
jgi:dihydrofolate reductase